MLMWLILHPHQENFSWPSASSSREPKVRVSLKSVDRILGGSEGARETMLRSKLLQKPKVTSERMKETSGRSAP